MRRAVSWFIAYSPAIFLAALIAYVLCGCGVPAAEPSAATDPATTVTVHVPFPTVSLFDKPATATAPAATVTPRTTEAPFDCAAYVNSLPYEVGNPDPAREAYRVTASCRGWSQAAIDTWERFIVDDVMRGESNWCPNVRGGAIMTGVGCGIARQGTKSDAGVMQLIRLWYEPGGPLCRAEGMCSADAITGTAWASFNAGLFAIEFDGRGPWSYNAFAKSYHPLWSTVPRYWS